MERCYNWYTRYIPTADSEIILLKMLDDIIEVNQLLKMKKSMLDLIYFHDLTLVEVHDDVWVTKDEDIDMLDAF